ncbi:MAG TPA: hypothetical protein VMI54_04560 [Polyangiaceae bacterium]|nr:hypothetical protein [Polyangiaceae bacterium]
MRVRSFLAFGFVAATLGACSSEPIASGGGMTGGTGGDTTSAQGGASASGAQGGSAGTDTATVTDYTTSPCYGQPSSTEVYDLSTHATHTVTATCRAEGEFARVYVTDELWETQADPSAEPLDQDQINEFMAGYELHGASGSYRPDLGVLPTDEAVFGALPPVQLTDGKLAIYIVDSGGAGQGYLCSWCATTQLHLDYISLGSLHSDLTFSIAAHESYHAIHHGYDPTEVFWIDETFAESAMTVNGYYTDSAWVATFLHDTNVEWGPGLSSDTDFNYGAGLLLGTFLWERDGAPFLAAVTQDPKHEWAGVDSALATVGDTETSWQLWSDLGLAIFLDDPASGYAIKSFELGAKVQPIVATTGTPVTQTLAPYGFVYVTFGADATRLTLKSDGDIASRLVYPGTPADVRELTVGQSVDLEGTPRVLLLTAQQKTPFELDVE